MGAMQNIRDWMARLAGSGEELTPRQRYGLYWAYYQNNGLYSAASRQLYEVDTWRPDMTALRTPVERVVEFYASHVWPGALPAALPIVAENERIIEPLWQVWKWSNWGAMKTLAARWAALYGDLFVKVASRQDGKPYLQTLDPQYVTHFEADERDVVTWIRIDLPQTAADGKPYLLTEVWDKAAGTFRRWRTTRTPDDDLARLGAPEEEKPFGAFGIDFVPIVHEKFRDLGETHGANAFVHALDKIDEANLLATRLHQQLFRHNGVTWALEANAVDGDGRPLPPPRISSSAAGAGSNSGVVELAGERMVKLPGMAKLVPLVPQLPYGDALAILNAHMLELEKDLPELAYYRLRESGGDLSGRAVRLLLSDAVDRVVETRGNLETALARADAMALTLGVNAGVWRGLGTYEADDFEHTFAEREVIPLSEAERFELVTAMVNAGVPLVTALRRAGWSQADIDAMLEDQRAQAEHSQAALGTSLTAALKQFDAGQAPTV